MLADDLEQQTGLGLVGDAEPSLGSRTIVKQLTIRTVRDRAFAEQIRTAYAGQCALTGLKVANGGGWLEMEAAHIQPVKDHGPDSVRNGIALSRTVHALFDRGFISLDDNFRVLVSKSHPIPDKLQRLLLERAQVPESVNVRPHPEFVAYHRSQIFKDRAA